VKSYTVTVSIAIRQYIVATLVF